MISLATAMIAVAVVRQFERPLEEVIALAVILPLVAAVGGHAASQTLTVMVRGIAIGEVTGDTSRRALWKECMVGMVNGVVVGCSGALAIGVWFRSWALGAVMLGSLFLLLLVAALAGALIPMTLKKLNFDPAMASSVFVVTVTDVLGFLSFLGLGTLALDWLK
jgi:magnesium transporter